MSKNIYIGDNIHSYTSYIKEKIPRYFTEINIKISGEDWDNLKKELLESYQNHLAIRNIINSYKDNFIRDPEIPNINFAIILLQLWQLIKINNLENYFKETLDWIASTCIQGVTHRIFIDYVALYDDYMMSYLEKLYSKKCSEIIFSYL